MRDLIIVLKAVRLQINPHLMVYPSFSQITQLANSTIAF